MALGGRSRLPRYVPLCLLFSCTLGASKPSEPEHAHKPKEEPHRSKHKLEEHKHKEERHVPKHKREEHRHNHKWKPPPNPDCSSQTCGGKDRENYPPDSSCPTVAMTNCHGGHHGFGNQYALFMGHYAWARRNNWTFCPTRWTRMDHLSSSGGSQMFDFVGGPQYGPHAKFNTTAAWRMRMNLKLMDQEVVDEIRSFYFKAPKRQAVQAHRFRGSANQTTFVWHIRGADVQPPNASFINKGLETLKRRYGEQMQTVDFISCGLPQDYRNITAYCAGHLGVACNMLLRHRCRSYDQPGQQQVEELQEDFHRMVTADVMVYGFSTLSTCASILNSGATHLDTDLAQGVATSQGFAAKGLALDAALADECGVVPLAQ